MDKSNWLMPPNEWQFVDLSNGFIYPWYTLGCLEFLEKLDMSKWTVFEAGCGASTLWWAKRCKKVVALEVRREWRDKVEAFAKEKGIDNIEFNLVEFDVQSDSVTKELYLDVLRNQTEKFNAVIIDGSHRDAMAIIAVDNFIKTNGLLVVDNWEQFEVYEHPNCKEYLNSRFPIRIFKQLPISDPAHDPRIWDGNAGLFPKLTAGHPHWQTACWRIKKKK